MDTARDKTTLELVEAEELWNMTEVDKDGYICRGCTVQVYPASFLKDVNKKRPYFSLRENKHIADCDVTGEIKIIKRGKKERVGTSQGFPMPFPSKLVLNDDREVKNDAPKLPTISPDTRTSSSSSSSSSGERKYHGHTINTIRPACRTFINFPHDRDFLPLTMPGVSGDKYGKVFKYIRNQKPVFFNEPTYLYYALIRWKEKPVITDAYCELTLNSGEWDEKLKDIKNVCKVRVNWADWSKSRSDSLIREFETTRIEAREKAKEDQLTKGWIFFVGTQDATDPSIFHVDNYRLICCLEAVLIWK